MKWLRRRLRNWLSNDLTSSDAELVKASDSRSLRASGLNFTLYSANGGYVVEVRTPERNVATNGYSGRQTSDSECNLHIITVDEDLGERIGQIVTIEVIRQ